MRNQTNSQYLSIFYFKNLKVDENCCTEDGKKWTNLFNVTTSPGKVCCNAPCNDANEISGCARPDSCPSEIQARTLGSYGYGTVESSEVGINPEVFNQIVKYGKHYENVFATLPDNTNKYEVKILAIFSNFSNRY